MPLTLYIVRHAWAGEPDLSQYPDDRDRPLTREGRLRFREEVRRLKVGGFAPQVLATSPLVRCRQTAEIIAEAIPTLEVVTLPALEPGATLTELLNWTSGLSAKEVAWVGHAPDVGRLTAELVGDGGADLRFAKGAVAAIRFDALIRRGGGELRWFATAKLLGC